MSFTAGGLLYQESVKIAELYWDLGDWSTVRNQVLEKNILQSRTLNTAKRVYREISARLKLLSGEELKIAIEGSRQEQNHILWLAICKRYQFIYDFAVGVVREKFLQLNLELTLEDYDAFFNAKAEWHDELERLTNETRNKLRQIVFKMLREAELVSKDNIINPVILTPHVVKTICKDTQANLAVFPISDADIKVWAK